MKILEEESGGWGERAYIWDVNWVTYLGGVLTGCYGISNMVLFSN